MIMVPEAPDVVIGENNRNVCSTWSSRFHHYRRIVSWRQAGVAGHLKVGDNVTMAAKTGATNNIKDNTMLMGAWGIEASRYRRSEAVFRNLPELAAEVNKLKKEIKNIKNE
jgi:UDP-3-O-[3-hydroxymyristoyl] glucosamine N-acyltransferase